MKKLDIVLKAAGLIWVFSGCSGAPKKPPYTFRFERAKEYRAIVPAWTQKMPGLITDIAMAANGSTVVATVPAPEGDGGGPRLIQLDSTGSVLWKLNLVTRIKALATSSDGQLVVASSYNEKVTAFDAKGKPLWFIDEMCRPVLLERRQQILCFFDDDSKPDFAFEVYTYLGKKLVTHPVHHDVLALRVSHDDRWIVYAQTGGQIALLNEQFQVVWRAKVPGETVQLDVSSGPDPRVAVLFNSKVGTSSQQLAIFNSKGKLEEKTALERPAEQLIVDPSGSKIMIYGNNPQGQHVSHYSRGDKLRADWSLFDQRFADFSSNLALALEGVVVGFEDIVTPESHQRQSHLFEFDRSGKVLWDLPVQTQEGAYLYVQAFSADRQMVVVAGDDGTLNGYRIK